ncbi:hypothetical protein J4217_01255 [Candidatus Pacearchaeota archaeon]|nr:hypothetical protein [Candidatus Pacearchaeota archaeon]
MDNKLTGRSVKTGFLEGFVDGTLMKTFWNRETRDSKKTISYMIGMIVVGNIQPFANTCILYDLIKGNYKK